MRNFILFIVAVCLLSFAAFVLYRVYVKGESTGQVFQELRGSEDKEKPDEQLAEAKDAYHEGKYSEALKGFEAVLDAYETGQPGASLEEQQHKDLLILIGNCYTKLWEAGGKTNDTLRIKALRTYEKYIEEFPDLPHKHIRRAMGNLRNSTPTTSPESVSETEVESETIDESPP